MRCDHLLPLRAERRERHLLRVDLALVAGNVHNPTWSASDSWDKPFTAAACASSSLVLPPPADAPIDPDTSSTSSTRAGLRRSDHAARTAASTGGLGGDSVTPTSSAR